MTAHVLKRLVPSLLLAIATSTSGCVTKSKQSNELGSDGYSGHGAASVPSETLAKFAPKPLPPEVSRRIQSMLDIKSPGLGVVAHGGRRLFFEWSITGTPQVWRLNSPLGFPEQMTGGSDMTRIVGLTPNGKTLIISRDRNGEENPGIYLQSVEGGELKVVFHKTGVRASLRWISDDSRSLYYTANDIKADSYALYRHDIPSGERTLIFDQPGLWFLGDLRDDGMMLMIKLTGARSSESWLYNPKTKELSPIVGQNEREEYYVTFGPRHGEYLVQTNKFGNFRRLYRFAGGRFTPLSPERPMDVESFQIDVPRRRILVEWNEQGFMKLEAYDARTFRPLPLPRFKDATHVYAGSFTRDGRFMTIGVGSPTAPRTSYVLDWSTGKTTQWVLPSAPEIDTRRFSEAKLEFYPARDGTKIPMLVRRPLTCAATACPVIVNFHGGPEGQSRPGFSPYAQIFVDAGFTYIEPNVRGSDGFGKDWLRADDGPRRLQVITDIEDIALHIRRTWTEKGVAPKIGIMGGSYGGYSTLMGMTRFAGAYDAGVSAVGMSDLITFLMNTAPYRRILRITEYGDPEKDRQALVELSPITHLNKIRAPLLLIQGVSDPRVPAGEAIQMHEAMRAKGLASDLILFADEGHGSVKRENQVLEIGHTLSFFQKHLLGGGR